MIEVTLVQNHTHEGKQYYAGQTVSLPEEDADWLVKAVIGTRVETRKQVEKILKPVVDKK